MTGSGLPGSSPNMTIAAPITTTATAGFTKTGNGVLQVTSNNPTLPVTASAGTVLADGDPTIAETFGAVTLKGGTLGGARLGRLDRGPGTGGTIQPAENSLTPTTLTTTTTAAQTWNSAHHPVVGAKRPGPGDYSVLSLNGDLNINGASLAGFAGLRRPPRRHVHRADDDRDDHRHLRVRRDRHERARTSSSSAARSSTPCTPASRSS